MSIEKMYCNETRKLLSQQHLFKLFSFVFFFVILEVAYLKSVSF